MPQQMKMVWSSHQHQPYGKRASVWSVGTSSITRVQWHALAKPPGDVASIAVSCTARPHGETALARMTKPNTTVTTPPSYNYDGIVPAHTPDIDHRLGAMWAGLSHPDRARVLRGGRCGLCALSLKARVRKVNNVSCDTPRIKKTSPSGLGMTAAVHPHRIGTARLVLRGNPVVLRS